MVSLATSDPFSSDEFSPVGLSFSSQSKFILKSHLKQKSWGFHKWAKHQQECPGLRAKETRSNVLIYLSMPLWILTVMICFQSSSVWHLIAGKKKKHEKTKTHNPKAQTWQIRKKWFWKMLTWGTSTVMHCYLIFLWTSDKMIRPGTSLSGEKTLPGAPPPLRSRTAHTAHLLALLISPGFPDQQMSCGHSLKGCVCFWVSH